MLFDSHTHINNESYTEEEREELIRGIEASELLSWCTDIGFDLPSSILAAQHAEKYPWCFAAVGVHPHDSGSMTEEILETLRRLAAQPGVRAIGEIGLDYHYMYSEKEDQRYWFRRQIRLANELRMPIVIHSREADQETMDILAAEGAFSGERQSWFPKRPGPDGTEVPDARVDIHCFSGSAELAAEYVKLGATIGLCGPLTYKNNKKTVRVAEQIPLEYLMVETDAPYLTPVPKRGEPNKPWYVEYTARRLAEIKGITFEEAARATCGNALRFFGTD